MTRYILLVAILVLGLTTTAQAHPRLVNSSPAANATVPSTSVVTLSFSERLMTGLSGADVAMTGMPGMANHAAMPVSGVRTSVGKDGKTLIARFARALPRGTYKVDWHVVSADTHRINGSITFTVR
jgi:methionine-rich copper-binding protein CopC